eukprot:991744-Lingulodinium_polyedra.AAC.1
MLEVASGAICTNLVNGCGTRATYVLGKRAPHRPVPTLARVEVDLVRNLIQTPPANLSRELRSRSD